MTENFPTFPCCECDRNGHCGDYADRCPKITQYYVDVDRPEPVLPKPQKPERPAYRSLAEEEDDFMFTLQNWKRHR